MRAIDSDIPAAEVKEILQTTGTVTPVCQTNRAGERINQCPPDEIEHWIVMNADAAVRELLDRRGISIPEGTTVVVEEAETESQTVVMPVSAGSPTTDRDALAALYNATSGQQWRETTNWLSNAPMNQWHGVATDTTGRVTSLRLSNNWISGELPPELGNLSRLKILSLTGNPLMGAIPEELGRLVNLEYLNLQSNQLTGGIPSKFGNLSNLESLNLSVNELSGGIPSELGNLSNLESLNLIGNQLRGGIPPKMGNLTGLESVLIGNNLLNGEIPPQLGNLVNLRHLDLSNNQFNGKLPAELNELWKLSRLVLKDNQFTGCLPYKLEVVPSTDSHGLGLPYCEDTVPALSLASDADRDALGAIYHAANGGSWENNRNWNWGTDAPISRWAGVYTNSSGRVIALKYSVVGVSRWQYDHRGGRIRVGTGQVSEQLRRLTSLQALDLSVGGPVASAAIPSTLGQLTNLRELRIAGGSVGAPTMTELGNLTNLESLHFSGGSFSNLPAEFGNLSNLRELHISGSYIGGPIPAELGNLVNLKELHLRGERLSSGIPPELGNLVNLESLTLGGEGLTGGIPEELGNLRSLRNLSFGINELSGCLPMTFEWLPHSHFEQLGLPFCAP